MSKTEYAELCAAEMRRQRTKQAAREKAAEVLAGKPVERLKRIMGVCA